MNYMFEDSKFTGDISEWDVSNVKNMREMFYESQFDGDISKWDVSSVETMEDIFTKAPLGEHEPEWWFRHREQESTDYTRTARLRLITERVRSVLSRLI